MKRKSTLLLQIVVVLVGLGALAFLVWEPQTEGRNAHATLLQTYFTDPFLAYVYVASIPFFVALYQVFKVLGHAGHDQAFSLETVKALRRIRYCSLAMVGFVVGSVFFMLLADPDDRPAGVFLRVIVAVSSIVIATAATVSERVLQNVISRKSRNGRAA